MFGKLSAVFGKNFAVGYFLPSFLFLVANLALFGIPTWVAKSNSVSDWTEADTLRAATIATIIAWLGGISLVAFNRAILRILEGYGALNPLRLLSFWPRYRFRKKLERRAELDTLEAEYPGNDPKQFNKIRSERARVIRELAEYYPDDAAWLLPTAFGNIMRGFEVYSRVIYGADAITLWPRLLAIIPEKTRAILDDAKANVDLWTNVLVLSLCFTFEVCIYLDWQDRAFIWTALGCFTFVLIARSRTHSAALEWGLIVKSYFDVFLPELRQKLQLRPPVSHTEEISMWQSFTQTAEYRDRGAMPHRDFGTLSSSTPQPGRDDDKGDDAEETTEEDDSSED